MNRTVAAATIQPPDLLTLGTSLPRSPRASDLSAELASFYELSRVIAETPQRASRRLLEISLGLCNAGSAGISLLQHNAEGQAVVRWEAISGALAAQQGIDTLRDLSPCGMCLDLGVTILLLRPERVFDSLSEIDPPIVENLVVPLYDASHKALGTLWIAHHDSTSRCTAEDARILEQLAIHLVLALRLLDYARESEHAHAVAESCELTLQTAVHFLVEERRRREHAEATESDLRQAMPSKDAQIRELRQERRSSQSESLSQ
ncbi:MAG: GAF domain-containing protein [Steroidobacteraceae bacterium]